MRAVFWSLFACSMVLGIAWAWAIHEGGAKGLHRIATLLRGLFLGLGLYLVSGAIAAILSLYLPPT